MKILALTSSIAALIVLAAYVGRMSRPAVCINSSLVERLDIVADTLAKSLQRCGDEWSLEKISSQERKWLKKIDTEASDFMSFSKSSFLQPPFGITVRIHLDRPHLWSVTEQRIDLGIDVFESKGQLERAFLLAALKRQASGNVKENTLFLEILADQILLLGRGELGLIDPVSGQSPQAPWPTHIQINMALQTQSSICMSPWKLGRTLNKCSLDSAEIAEDSVRGIVTILSQNKIRKMGLSERKSQLRNMVKLLKVADLPKAEPLKTVEETVILAESYLGLVWNSQVIVEWKPTLLDALIESDTERLDLMKEFAHDPDYRIIVRSGHKFQLAPSGPYLESHLELPLPKRRIRVSKSQLNAGTIAQLESGDERVLEIINAENSEIHLKPYVISGASSFVTSNPNLKFVVYHIPSVRLALSFGLNPQAVLKRSTSKLTEKMSRILGLSQPSNGSHYNQAPISAMEWYHF